MNNQSAVVPYDTMSLSTKARRRMRTSREETAVLEDFYSKSPNPNHEQKQEIANAVQMGVRNVHFWFQNRRAKDNKKRKLLQMRQQELAQQQQQQLQQQQLSPHQQTPQVQLYPQQNYHSYQQQSKGKGKFNLPPISSIMVPRFHDLSIPFYFHHSKFGIEDCMIQWSEVNDTQY